MRIATLGNVVLLPAALLAIAAGILFWSNPWAVYVLQAGLIGLLVTGALTDDPLSRRVTPEPWARRAGALACIGSGVLLVTLNATAVLVMLPTLVRAVPGISSGAVAMFPVAYLLGLAAFVPLAGPLGDAIGRRRTFMFGLAIFGSGWVLVLDSPIVALMLQGIGTTLATGPGTMSLVRRLFPNARGRLAMAGSAVVAVGLALGLVLDGVLVAINPWAISAMNMVAAIITLLVTRYVVPESRNVEAPASIDLFNPGLLTVGLLFMGQGFIGHAVGAPGGGIFTSLGAIALAVVLVRVVWRTGKNRSSGIPPRLSRGQLPFAALANATLSFVACGGAVMATCYLAFVWELPPLELGLALLPIPVGLVCGNVIAEWLVDRVGPPPVIMASVLFVAIAAMSMYVLTPHGSYWVPMALALFVGGLAVRAGVVATRRWTRASDLPWIPVKEARTFLRQVRLSMGAVGVFFVAAYVEWSYREGLLADAAAQAGSGAFPELIPPAGPSWAFADHDAFVQAMGTSMLEIGAVVFGASLLVGIWYLLVTRTPDEATT